MINVNPTHIIKWLLNVQILFFFLNVQILDYTEYLARGLARLKSHTDMGKHAGRLLVL